MSNEQKKAQEKRFSFKDTKDAVGYIRVSTQEQAADDRFGVEMQRGAILSWADRNGYIIRDWFIDEISGTAEERPEWGKILHSDEITNPPYDAVIVFKNDRIARDTKLFFYYQFILEKRGVRLVSVQEEFDEGSDFANIYRALILFVAEQERKNITLRTSEGRNVKALTGGYSGGQAPYGYMVREHCLVPNPEEAKVVRLMFRLYDKGQSMARVAEFLNMQGIKTRVGGLWYPQLLHKIKMNRPTYEGMYHYGKHKTWVKGQHEPILETVFNPFDPNDHSKKRAIKE